MKIFQNLVLLLLAVFATSAARGQVLDPVDTLPVSMQAQVGTTTAISCQKAQSVPFTSTSGTSGQLKCGDWFTILGAHENSYAIRTESGLTGYVPATAVPATGPCAQTNFRIAWFNHQWMPKFKSMSRDDAEKFIDGLYLKATPDDISVAYRCVEQAMGSQENTGGYNGYLSNFDLSEQSQTYSSEQKQQMTDFTVALHDEAAALQFLNRISAAQLQDDDRRYGELVIQYNSLVDRHNELIRFADQEMLDLKKASPPQARSQPPAWRRILAGALQGMASYSPPRRLVCRTTGNVSVLGDTPETGDYIYLSGDLTSRTECEQQ